MAQESALAEMGRPRRRSREHPLATVVLDRYSLWVETVKQLAEGAGMSVVAATTSPQEAIEALGARRPSLFILGLERTAIRPGVLEALMQAAAEVSGLATVVVANDDDPNLVEQCLSSGACAYVLKTVHPDDLKTAIRQAVRPSVYLFARPSRSRSARGTKSDASKVPKLTSRELEVLRLVAEGLPNAEVARRLWISQPTVKYHLSRTYEKLGVSNRTGAARLAERYGLLGGAPS
jgi:DNA-binding NarL/FixJ family response regulator